MGSSWGGKQGRGGRAEIVSGYSRQSALPTCKFAQFSPITYRSCTTLLHLGCMRLCFYVDSVLSRQCLSAPRFAVLLPKVPQQPRDHCCLGTGPYRHFMRLFHRYWLSRTIAAMITIMQPPVTTQIPAHPHPTTQLRPDAWPHPNSN